MKPFSFPEDFRFGTATASLQIEGGNTNNSWYRWSQQGRIRDASSPLTACDHWNRIEEDVRLMSGLSMNAYRLSLEWARIEPEEGRFDPDAVARYRHEIELLKAAGIEPLVTLHHFSNPLWLEDGGGWTDARVIARFERYVSHVVENLGDLVRDWVTINEPNVYLLFGYVTGEWPPGKTDLGLFFAGAKNMILAHIAAYRAIHRLAGERGWEPVRAGVSHHLRIRDPLRNLPHEKLVSGVYTRLTQDLFVAGMTEGRLLFPLGSGYPAGKRTYADFFGVNYYSRDMMAFVWNPSRMFGAMTVKTGCSVNDLGWEIYPEGLYRLCRQYYRRYRIPVLVTENGICDREDLQRPRYIYDHLAQVRRLLDEGVDVRGYYHWSLMDNFEWLEGESARFGLYAVDFTTQKRTLRRSGEFYGKIASAKGVSRDLIALYLETGNGKLSR